MATMATTPKASVTMLPPTATQAPCASGSRNVAVMGPEATPPASNAMAVKSLGTINEMAMANMYPGMRNHRMETPVSTRTMASPTERETPAERAMPMAWAEMAPSVTSSTCLFST